MPIKLFFAGRPPIELRNEQITLGSGPACTVNLPASDHVRSNHVVIRLIDGRWIMEVREAESFFVSGAGQKKAHWLSSGNVIRLSDDGPVVKVELVEESLVVVDEASVRRSQRKAVKSDVALLDEVRPLVKPSDVILLPDSDAEIPSVDVAPLRLADEAPRSSSSRIDIPKQAVPLTDSADVLPPPTVTIRASKAPTSTTIPILDAPSSGTIRTSRSKSGEVPVGKGSMKSSKTDANLPARGARRSGSSAQIPVTDPNEPAAGVPVLKRLSSWEAPVAKGDDDDDMLSLGEPIGRRRKGHDADVEWIKMVVIRCAAVGLVVLLAWLSIREIWKAMAPAPTPLVPTVSTPLSQASTRV
ncbi:FHA domain-containing protein [Schlesneria paludicola]|uniref:FHA domain-containing protein n=1 Tax=Schlesneria paludicola TaxID=360056 RepID=UPI00029B5072|nr:FHA domain-containing protein [Schlesneria paludicola]